MTLTLTILASPAPLSPRTRQVRQGAFSLGRAADNDWTLADPERHLSKRHCVIAAANGFWEVTDRSTNGTFLNDEAEPIGNGNVRDLRDGDRLRLGGYEIALRIETPKMLAEHPSPLPFAEPLTLAPNPTPLGSDSLAISVSPDPVQPDHTPGIEDAFRPPQPVVLLDEDWDIDATPARSVVAERSLASPAAPEYGEPLVSQAEAPDLLRAFLRGAGLPDANPQDPAATMESLGAVFRALVSGLRETLIARAAVKEEFRITQTVIRPRGNNPLKFAASDDDAMLALLGTGRRTEMGPAEAVREALCDIRLHELATMAAMQSAARNLLRELSPVKLRDEAGAGGLLAQQRKARAWDAFEALHARLTQALADDFDSTFGRAFARAYEQALRDSKT